MVETRLQAIQTVLIALTLGVPAFGQAVMRHHDFTSRWFVAAIVFFVLSMSVAIIARTWGTVILADPARIYRLAGYSEWEFKRTVLYWAGEHFGSNVSLTNWKGRMTDLMVGLMGAEVVCLAVWIGAGL